MWPSVMSSLSKTTNQDYQGRVQGIASSAGSLASIFGLTVGGVLYGSMGPFVFAFAALFILIAFFAALGLRSLPPQSSALEASA